jgi:hypothetical protein
MAQMSSRVAVRRNVVALALWLSACAGNDTPVAPHSAGTCDGGWTQNGFDQCEAACADSSIALDASGASCEAMTIAGDSISCSKTFVFSGVTGCCAADTPSVLFAECQ